MKIKRTILFSAALGISIFIYIQTGCKKEEEPEKIPPTVSSFPVTDVTQTTATSGGNISAQGSSTITARGVCWNLNGNPTLLDNIGQTSDGAGNGHFTSEITGLSPNTTYYLRAYATNSSGTGYGNSVIAKTYTGTVTDIDGNVYNTVTIGTQLWMVENLNVTHYRNGSPIPNITGGEWSNLTTGAYCNYYNNPVFSLEYGKLYNWYATLDNRKIAPTGWHVPTNNEWTILINYLGGHSVASGKLKDVTHWNYPNAGATNESGFTAIPGGRRGFDSIGTGGYWWSDTGYSNTHAWYRSLNSDNLYIGYDPGLLMGDGNKKEGYSIRCVKD